MSEPWQVSDDPAASRFEVTADGQRAELKYRRTRNRLVLIHTGVPTALEGLGIGGRLVAAAAGQAAREGMTLVPLCPFARAWLQRHPEVAGTVTIDWGRHPPR